MQAATVYCFFRFIVNEQLKKFEKSSTFAYYSFGNLSPLHTSFNNSLGSTSIAKAIK